MDSFYAVPSRLVTAIADVANTTKLSPEFGGYKVSQRRRRSASQAKASEKARPAPIAAYADPRTYSRRVRRARLMRSERVRGRGAPGRAQLSCDEVSAAAVVQPVEVGRKDDEGGGMKEEQEEKENNKIKINERIPNMRDHVCDSAGIYARTNTLRACESMGAGRRVLRRRGGRGVGREVRERKIRELTSSQYHAPVGFFLNPQQHKWNWTIYKFLRSQGHRSPSRYQRDWPVSSSEKEKFMLQSKSENWIRGSQTLSECFGIFRRVPLCSTYTSPAIWNDSVLVGALSLCALGSSFCRLSAKPSLFNEPLSLESGPNCRFKLTWIFNQLNS
ncbi:hypothetical protein C8J57DRAFT_1213474 [Mycena rebaudengoi]|nr:hypothetical protein C8J57DRAFT_1213474 [Mycena rebaudengoi]